MRCSRVAKSNSVMVKVLVDGRKVISVPVRGPSAAGGAAPVSSSLPSASPWAKRMAYSLPSRQMQRLSHSESALTTEMPTPCRPPATL